MTANNSRANGGRRTHRRSSVSEDRYANALVACLSLARDVKEDAIFARSPEKAQALTIQLAEIQDQMERRVFEITGHRYALPRREL